jgi:hypothetical protein
MKIQYLVRLSLRRIPTPGPEMFCWHAHRGRTQRHAVDAEVRVLFRNLDEVANERAELARLLNKAGTCFLFETVQGRYVPYGTSLYVLSAYDTSPYFISWRFYVPICFIPEGTGTIFRVWSMGWWSSFGGD